ncbi:hypothetical protein PN478_09900 [Dolichospermum circinale CS-534/05]|uniref:hypothetical protein n=1 Tax=Dolichospermum circinale TaxID=109265 RepID=UPI00232ADF48|nr:hypothetical protein [Dolichospermum circinale]MDB9453118.1 hypothetical protein [Dolichospermum circinale CS-541/06]MDB9464547.1 hypothetical protein [Dolichospermum circinale CS-541/04]MDB9490833.1 hypothetical protein [Dolichospermum circinale CS-534/05]MDB9546391.1 hypothetical protein [Dolichospermum circinale CS-1031]
MKPILSQIEKEYSPRGPLHQFRFKEAIAFHCFRCGTSKKAKLLTIYGQDWNRRLCNGCYGRLLSIYEIKTGTDDDNEKAEALANLLLSLFNKDQALECQRLFRISEQRALFLSKSTLRFVATAEYVSKSLDGITNLDWSPAIIGLCKAVEMEVVERLVIPLTVLHNSSALDEDVKDKDIGRIAKFCRDGLGKPPELGTFAHFLQTTINSEKRRATSILMQKFIDLMKNCPNANWILDINGLHSSLSLLTNEYRNRAAHIDDLAQLDYENCRSLMKIDPELPEDLPIGSRQRKEELLKRGLSTFYVGLCFDAYYQKFISAGRLAEMLLVDHSELQNLANIYGQNLNYGD